MSDSRGSVFVEYLTVLSLGALALSAALVALGIHQARIGSAQGESFLQRYP